MKIEVELPESEVKRFEDWKESVKNNVLKQQQQNLNPEDFDRLTGSGKHPYAGAIGGSLTWHITFTSIGPCVTAEYWGEKFDFDMDW